MFLFATFQIKNVRTFQIKNLVIILVPTFKNLNKDIIMNKEAENLTKSGREQLSKLRHIVQESIDEEKLVVENLLNEPKEMLTRGQSISDKVARFGGSWSFILSFSCVLFAWIIFNSYVSTARRFDPYPFILMNL